MVIRDGLINELHNVYGAILSKSEIAKHVDNYNEVDKSQQVYDENEQVNEDFERAVVDLSETLEEEYFN